MQIQKLFITGRTPGILSLVTSRTSAERSNFDSKLKVQALSVANAGATSVWTYIANDKRGGGTRAYTVKQIGWLVCNPPWTRATTRSSLC